MGKPFFDKFLWLHVKKIHMKRREYESHIEKIVTRLNELTEQDRAMIEAQPSRPVTVSVEQLWAYGNRVDERQRLQDELRNLASELIED